MKLRMQEKELELYMYVYIFQGINGCKCFFFSCEISLFIGKQFNFEKGRKKKEKSEKL